MPSERSVYLTRRLIPGADTLSNFAAPPMVPVTITARITSTWRSVIMVLAPEGLASERDRGGDHLTRDALSSSGKCLAMWMGEGKPHPCPGRAATRIALRRRVGTQKEQEANFAVRVFRLKSARSNGRVA